MAQLLGDVTGLLASDQQEVIVVKVNGTPHGVLSNISDGDQRPIVDPFVFNERKIQLLAGIEETEIGWQIGGCQWAIGRVGQALDEEHGRRLLRDAYPSPRLFIFSIHDAIVFDGHCHRRGLEGEAPAFRKDAPPSVPGFGLELVFMKLAGGQYLDRLFGPSRQGDQCDEGYYRRVSDGLFSQRI